MQSVRICGVGRSEGEGGCQGDCCLSDALAARWQWSDPCLKPIDTLMFSVHSLRVASLQPLAATGAQHVCLQPTYGTMG